MHSAITRQCGPQSDSPGAAGLPLDLLGPLDPLGGQQVRHWSWAFLALGVAARVLRYALRFPLWADECFLSANLLDRGYLDLLEGLDYGQVCPFLFLWLQQTLVRLFG